jgi:hypothetical protein
MQPQRYYLLTSRSTVAHYEQLVGGAELRMVADSGGKVLLTNQPIEPAPFSPAPMGH